MKTVALRVTARDLDELRDAFADRLADVDTWQQRQRGLELIGLWFKLEDAARETNSILSYEGELPKWVAQKMREVLRTAGQVDELKRKVEDLELRAKARGVTAAAQPPSVTKARKKPARKSKPAHKVPVDAPQPAPVT